MKEAKAYINLSLNRNLSTANYVGVEEAIRQAQKDAYNQAIMDATMNVRLYKAANSGSWLDAAINTESILKLKKQ